MFNHTRRPENDQSRQEIHRRVDGRGDERHGVGEKDDGNLCTEEEEVLRSKGSQEVRGARCRMLGARTHDEEVDVDRELDLDPESLLSCC